MTNRIPLLLPESFESNRLHLRCYREDDAAWCYEMSVRNREHLRRYESGNVMMTLESPEHTKATLIELKKYWEEETCLFIGCFSKDTSEFVGQIYVGPFSVQPPDYIIGYFADVDHEGRGYITEAVQTVIGLIFELLGAHRVRIHCDATNVRSQGVAERCGFTREGLIRQDHRNPDGSLSDTVIYGLLRNEYARVE